MNEIKSYLFSTQDGSNRPEYWEINVFRTDQDSFMAMAQERQTQQMIGWKELDANTEAAAFGMMANEISAKQSKGSAKIRLVKPKKVGAKK